MQDGRHPRVCPRDACDSRDDASHGNALRVTQKARVTPWYIAAMSAIIKWVFYDRGTLRPRFSRKRCSWLLQDKGGHLSW